MSMLHLPHELRKNNAPLEAATFISIYYKETNNTRSSMTSPRRSLRLHGNSSSRDVPPEETTPAPPVEKLNLCRPGARKVVCQLPARIKDAWASLAWDEPSQEAEAGPIHDAAEERRQIVEFLAHTNGVIFSHLADEFPENAILNGLTVRGDWHVCPRRSEEPPLIKLGDAEHCRTCSVLRVLMNNNGMLAFLM